MQIIFTQYQQMSYTNKYFLRLLEWLSLALQFAALSCWAWQFFWTWEFHKV